MSQKGKTVVAITGTNRGLGLEFVRQYCEQRDHLVIALCRKASSDLSDLATAHSNVHIVTLDATDQRSVNSAVEDVKKLASKIDLFINNAGLNPNSGAYKLSEVDDLEPCIQGFNVNVLGTIRVTKAFLPLLRESSSRKIIIFMSSGMGSISQTLQRKMGMMGAYSISKAALNMCAANFSNELYGDGFCCVAQDPGHVLTDMGGPHAPLKPKESIATMISAFDGLSHSDTGRYLAVQGDPGKTKIVEIEW